MSVNSVNYIRQEMECLTAIYLMQGRTSRTNIFPLTIYLVILVDRKYIGIYDSNISHAEKPITINDHRMSPLPTGKYVSKHSINYLSSIFRLALSVQTDLEILFPFCFKGV